ncbi:Uncharacterised protein [Mycobacteroides abscessus subsp. massiliense]|nr:Uncharacterised protein [Mycobacteroides abscessus subsp. massiliense]
MTCLISPLLASSLKRFKAGRSKSSSENPSWTYFSVSLVPAFFMQASIWLLMLDYLFLGR